MNQSEITGSNNCSPRKQQSAAVISDPGVLCKFLFHGAGKQASVSGGEWLSEVVGGKTLTTTCFQKNISADSDWKMASETVAPCATSCPSKDTVPYERIIVDLEKKPELKKELEDAADLLDYVLCRVPDPEDAKYKDDQVIEIKLKMTKC